MTKALDAFPYNSDPIKISYVLAVRGLRPVQTTDSFLYGFVDCVDADYLCALAGSNPEGSFIGLNRDAGWVEAAAQKVKQAGLKNVAFLQAAPETLLGQLQQAGLKQPSFDYLVIGTDCDRLTQTERTALLAAIPQLLAAGGALVSAHTALPASAMADPAQLIVPDLLADASGSPQEQLTSLMPILEQLAHRSSQLLQALGKARTENSIAPVRAVYPTPSDSPTKTIHAQYRALGLALVGNADITRNYIDMALPAAAHPSVLAQADHPAYETLKDVVMVNLKRVDIWVRPPLQATNNLVARFGSFAFFITDETLVSQQDVHTPGRTVVLNTPFDKALRGALASAPHNIGDLMTLPALAARPVQEVLMALQVLVAVGIAQPVRMMAAQNMSSVLRLRLSGSFNEQLRSQPAEPKVHYLAAPHAGRPMRLSETEYLCLRALDEGGFEKAAEILAGYLVAYQDHPLLRAYDLKSADKRVEAAGDMLGRLNGQQIMAWVTLGAMAA